MSDSRLTSKDVVEHILRIVPDTCVSDSRWDGPCAHDRGFVPSERRRRACISINPRHFIGCGGDAEQAMIELLCRMDDATKGRNVGQIFTLPEVVESPGWWDLDFSPIRFYARMSAGFTYFEDEPSE